LSKIESGTVTVEAEEIGFASLRDSVERNFRHISPIQKTCPSMSSLTRLPRAMTTDPKRLQQILKNLLSNAFKFTSQGHVTIRVGWRPSGWTPDHPLLGRVHNVVSFSIRDTGIGIAPEKQKLIFEAFQQADAGTSRKYGGTGLGLAISRELANLLGGEIRLISAPAKAAPSRCYLPLVSGTTNVLPRPNSTPIPIILPRPREENIPDDRIRSSPVIRFC
jgi:signal transduction histidine kinase